MTPRAFLPIAALVTITPGAATAMVIRSAMRGGWRAGVRTIAGNSIGVVVWALLSIAGISALVAASEVAFLVLKLLRRSGARVAGGSSPSLGRRRARRRRATGLTARSATAW